MVLIWFSQYMSKKLKAHGSLVNYISRVKKLHKIMGLPVPNFDNYILKMTLRGLHRLNTHIVEQARPITPTILEVMYAQLDMNKEEDILFWCASLLAFFLMFRKSNLMPDTKEGFNAPKQLC